MKTIKHPELGERQVPDWVEYIARNSNGDWMMFGSKPTDGFTDWYVLKGTSQPLIIPCKNWRESLTKV
jgi:hypothetical protein